MITIRICIFGDQGDGKTLSMVRLGLFYYFAGKKLFANFHLVEHPKGLPKIEYTFVSDDNFMKDIDFKDECCILLDELGITTSTRNTHAIHFGNILAQSRKATGEKSHFLMTAQHSHQASPSVRSLLDYTARPELYRDLNEEPVYAKLWLRKKVKGEDYFIPKKKPVILDKLDMACKYYDTSEIVDTFSDGRLKTLKQEYEEFIGTKGNTKNLATILQMKEKMGIQEADRFARAIILDVEL